MVFVVWEPMIDKEVRMEYWNYIILYQYKTEFLFLDSCTFKNMSLQSYCFWPVTDCVTNPFITANR